MADGIGTRIARRRQQLRMTQEELAARLGVAKSTVANWETGKHFPLRHLGAVEQVLGIRLDEEPEPDVIPPDIMDWIRREVPPETRAEFIAAARAALKGEPGAAGEPGAGRGAAGKGQSAPGRTAG